MDLIGHVLDDRTLIVTVQAWGKENTMMRPNFVECQFVLTTVIELGRRRGFVAGHFLGIF